MANVKAPYKNYERNQKLIIQAYKDLQADGSLMPSYKELSDKTKLSVNTIYNHFKRIDFDYICQRARIHTEDVTKALAERAKSGSARDIELFYRVVENFNPTRREEKNVIGDLNVNSQASGTIKIEVVRRGVSSREELAAVDEGKSQASGEQAKIEVKSGEAETSVNVNIPIPGGATAALLGIDD